MLIERRKEIHVDCEEMVLVGLCEQDVIDGVVCCCMHIDSVVSSCSVLCKMTPALQAFLKSALVPSLAWPCLR
jgi:hypothetical protein